MEQDQLLKTISKEELGALKAEQFSGRIVLVQSESMAKKAMRYLLDQPIVGFDTETRPSFKKGQMHKVALIQLSTPDTCFLIRLNQLGIFPLMKEFLESESVKKVGLSTKDDFTSLNRLAPVQPKGFIELQKLVKTYGIGEASLTKIYALLFGKRISKAQRLTNWEATELSEAQQRYAALDAWACLKIYDKLINS